MKRSLTRDEIEELQAHVSRLLWAEGGDTRGVADRVLGELPSDARRTEARIYIRAGIAEFGRQMRADGHRLYAIRPDSNQPA